jgi:PKD domain
VYLLQQTAYFHLHFRGKVPIKNEPIGDKPCPGLNNTFGYGRIDLFEAVSATIGTPYDVPWLSAGWLAGKLDPGGDFFTSVIFNSAGMEPGKYLAGIAIESKRPLSAYTSLAVGLTAFTPCEPLGDFSADFTPPVTMLGEVVTVTAGANGTQPTTYAWTFEDVSTATGQQVVLAFGRTGTHVVVVRISNEGDLVELEIDLTIALVLQRTLLRLIIR